METREMTFKESLSILRAPMQQEIEEADARAVRKAAAQRICAALDAASHAEEFLSQVEQKRAEAESEIDKAKNELASTKRAIQPEREKLDEIRRQVKVEQAKLDELRAEQAKANEIIEEAKEKQELLALASKLRALTN